MSSKAYITPAKLADIARESAGSHSQSYTQEPPVGYPASNSAPAEPCEHLGPNTPMRRTTHRTGAPLRKVQEVKEELERELEGSIIDLKGTPPRSIYPVIPGVDHKKIEGFLATSEYYDARRKIWKLLDKTTLLNKAPLLEDDLYKPLKKIIDHIIGKLGPKQVSVEDTHGRFIMHNENILLVPVDEEGKPLPSSKSAPDFCLMGRGTTFRREDPGVIQPSYHNCVAPLEIKTQAMLSSLGLRQVTLQVALYVRQCFVSQNNRRHVSAAIITERVFYLLTFDRAGCMRTKAINIHEDAATFVRMILGMCQFKDNYFNYFDPAIKHSTCTQRHLIMELKGTNTAAIKTKSRDMVRRHYTIVLNPVPFNRKSIRGRGTRCWLGTIVDSPSRQVTIKESWRSSGRAPESDILKDIAGIPGLGQMIAYCEDNEDSISKFRKVIIEDFEHSDQFHDRLFSRIVLEAYGPPIHYFKTKIQLLQALRDSISGHLALWKMGILHRDISIHNILLGKDDATQGNFGVLIDFDMAIRVEGYKPNKDSRTGTRAFQSFMVLTVTTHQEKSKPYIPHQDHLDDLESFFYCLIWICILYVGPKKMTNKPASDGEWENGTDLACATAKRRTMGTILASVTSWFEDDIFRKLLKGLAKMFKKIIDDKEDNIDEKVVPPTLQALQKSKDMDKYHNMFLAFLDTAISEQIAADKEREDANQPEPEYVPAEGEDIIEIDEDQAERPQLPLLEHEVTYKKRGHGSSDDEDDANASTAKKPHLEDADGAPTAGVSAMTLKDDKNVGGGK